MVSDIRSQHANIHRLVEPELRLECRDAVPDRRLVELVRLLARRAAREVYEQQTLKGRRKSRS